VFFMKDMSQLLIEALSDIVPLPGIAAGISRTLSIFTQRGKRKCPAFTGHLTKHGSTFRV